MTATFNPALTDTISRIRFKLGDTDVATADVQDETITALRQDGKTETAVAAEIAWGLVAKYSKLADTTVDDQLTRYSHVAKNWLAIAERLQQEADDESHTPGPGSPGIGGVIVTGIDDCRGPFSPSYFPYRGRG